MRSRAGLGVLALVVACSSSAQSVVTASDAGQTSDASAGGAQSQNDGGAGAPSAGAGNTEDAGVSLASACGLLFDASYGGKCQLPPIPADELARIRPRYVTWCMSDWTRPGKGGTGSIIAACVDALNAAPCYSSPQACLGAPGTLPAGAIVNGRDQCQSDDAQPLATAADAALTFPMCGTCDPLIPLGQPCGNAVTGSCGGSALCSRQTSTCVAVTIGGVGASCGTESELCGAGLSCGPDQKCIAQGQAGASCSSSLPCALTLHCAFTPATAATGTCQNGAALGAPCSDLTPCGPGLACSDAGSCVAVTFAAAGQQCSQLATCLSGSIDYCPFAPNSLTGTCPRVIADGQPCDVNDQTTTCDTFAGCQNGTCTLSDVLCK